jgi:competence protein ComEA
MRHAKGKILLCSLVLLLGLGFASLAVAGSKIVDLNKATAEELMAIESLDIPEELAQAIVKYREEHGPYKKADDFLKVPGMTQDFMETLNPQVKDGKVFYDPDAEPALAPSKC